MRYLVHDFAGHAFPIHLSRELAKRGHHVIHTYPVGLSGPKGRLERASSDSECFHVRPITLSGSFRKYSATRRLYAQRTYSADVCKLITAERPDVVLSANTPIDVQTRLLWHCRRNGIGFVHWVQDVYYLALEFFLRGKVGILSTLVCVPFRHLEKMVAAKSDAVIVIAPAFKNLLVEWGIPQSTINVIENWAPLEEVAIFGRRNEWSVSQGFDGQPIILYSGTLGLKHRPDLIYLLAKALVGQCRVVVVTQGLGREYLEKQPRLPNLSLLDFQPVERLPEVLASADVLLATLEADAGQFAVPSKILMYLCAGRALLMASPRDNLAASIVERSNAGIVVDSLDTEGLIAAARLLISDVNHRAQLSHNARKYAERTFDICTIATSFETILSQASRSPLSSTTLSTTPATSNK
jgi:colanic acid biosynthesis glycosyl transferase WcaI